ncbi:type II toxin-antitoxin system PemK/MazF family toxin [Candidatus Woesearchaeota archaeon]|nr:type II toxin-antitoxin system PemK/MazF family toxin [Candidatus Woesearchaeota archaeon]
MYKKKDIVLIPYSDLTGAKKRPAYILSDRIGEDYICCLITSKPSQGIPINNEDTSKPLPLRSWVKPHRLFTITEKIILKRLAKAKQSLHKKIVDNISGIIA